MSYSYTGYQLRQADYHPWQQPVSQPLLHPIRALDQQSSYPYPQDGRLHPQHQPYQARQPTSWDPPWLRQETAYQPPHHHPSQPIYQPPHHPIGSLDLQQSYHVDRHFHPQFHPYQARQPTCWDPPWVRTQQSSSTYDQAPLLYPQPPDQPDWQCLPTTNDVGHMEPLDMPCDPVTSESEPSLTVADLASQLEHLTAIVRELGSQMDSRERCLGDPQSATRPPPDPTTSVMYTEQVSCPLPQMTAAAPADLHHDPSRSSLPVVVAIPPPPATISLSCDSMELIAVDNDEAVESCPTTTIDRLPNCDQVGVEGVLLDLEETNGFLKASSRGMTIQEFYFQAQREALECIPVGWDLCETFCSYGVKAMVMYCPRRPRMRVILGIHEVDEGAINALAVHHHIWIDIGFIECQKVGETSLGIIASLSPSRGSAKQRSCTFDPGGSISRHFTRYWKKIEAFVGWETTTIQMCYHPHKYVLKLGTSVGVLALRQLCAILEDLHTFDSGGDTSPKLLVATLFVLSWFPP